MTGPGSPAVAAAGAQSDAREAVRAWVLVRNPELPAGHLRDDTPLLADRLVTSLQVLDLLLLLESLRDAPLRVADLTAGAFADIDTIVTTFLAGR